MAPAISISNRLLVALPREDLDFLRPHLEAVLLPHKQTLSEPNAPINHVHFVQEGMVSLVQPLENGAMIEVGMIGNEGFVGVPVLLGADTSPSKRWFKFPVLPCGCSQAHSGSKRAEAPPFWDCCFDMSRRSTPRSH